MADEYSKFADKIGVYAAPGSRIHIDKQIFQEKPQLKLKKDIPYRGSVHFVGRETELTTLHGDLQRGDYVAISGMGGLGKTELAIQYATRYKNDYGGITWFNARGNNLAEEVLKFFSSQLEIPQEQGGKLLTLQEQIDWCWLQYPDSEKPILIICDDVTELAQLQEILPSDNRFRVLVTTRTQNLDPNLIQSIRLGILSENQSLKLLQNLLKNQDKRITRESETAKEICQVLEYLPLGIILVGSYLVNDPGLSLAKMLAELQQRKLAAASLQDRENINQTQLGVKAAFDLTWEKLDIQSQQLGAFLSLFSPQLIVWEWVIYCLQFSGEQEERLTWTDTEINTAKKQLYQRSLLQLVTETEKPPVVIVNGAERNEAISNSETLVDNTPTETAEAYKIHNLLRWFWQEKLTELGAMQTVLERTFITPMIYVASQLPQSPSSEEIENFRYVVNHWEDLGKRLRDEINANTEPQTNLPASILADEIIAVFWGVGRFYEGQGLYNLAEPACQGCVEIYQTLFTGDHPDVANSLNNLAALYDNQGRYVEAEPLYIQALEMIKRLFTGDHPYVASSLNNLAALYNSQGRYTEAEPLYIQALEMIKRLFTGDHSYVATSWNNLAELYRNQGRYTEAEPLYIQALEMRKRLFTGDHPDVASSLNNLAALYDNQGRYVEAESLYIQALEMYERVLGVKHPNTVEARENLRLLRQWQKFMSVFDWLLVVLILPFYLLWLLIKPIVKIFWRWLGR